VQDAVGGAGRAVLGDRRLAVGHQDFELGLEGAFVETHRSGAGAIEDESGDRVWHGVSSLAVDREHAVLDSGVKTPPLVLGPRIRQARTGIRSCRPGAAKSKRRSACSARMPPKVMP